MICYYYLMFWVLGGRSKLTFLSTGSFGFQGVGHESNQ